MSPEEASQYLNGKYRSYDERAVRYRLATLAMIMMGLDENDSVLDFGGGDAELEKCMRDEFGWKGLYVNVDYVTGLDIKQVLAEHAANFRCDFVTGLEVIEHLDQPWVNIMLMRLPFYARKGVVLSTPDPLVQDVLAMDNTHVTPVYPVMFAARGYTVERHMLYDGYYSEGQVDGLIAYKKGLGK